MTDDLIQPGPESIDPGLAPGGVVIHVYEVPSGRLLTETRADSIEMAAYFAGRDSEMATERMADDAAGLCLVAYDGDDGHRFTVDDWL